MKVSISELPLTSVCTSGGRSTGTDALPPARGRRPGYLPSPSASQLVCTWIGTLQFPAGLHLLPRCAVVASLDTCEACQPVPDLSEVVPRESMKTEECLASR